MVLQFHLIRTGDQILLSVLGGGASKRLRSHAEREERGVNKHRNEKATDESDTTIST